MSGKGDKLRKGTNLKKFKENFDMINMSKNKSKTKKKITQKNNKTTIVYK